MISILKKESWIKEKEKEFGSNHPLIKRLKEINALSIKDFNKPVDIEVLDNDYYTEGETIILTNGCVDTKPLYKIIKIRLFNQNVNCYVIVDPHIQIERGKCRKVLQLIKDDNSSFILKKLSKPIINMCKDLNVETHILDEKGRPIELRDFFDITNDLYESNRLFVFGYLMPEETYELVINNFHSIANTYLFENSEMDDRIKTIYKMQSIVINDNTLNHSLVMPYTPHVIQIKKTKTGSTTCASKIGEIYDKATASNLLGFSTADSIIQGSLNGKTEHSQLDEIDAFPDNIMNHMSNYMERGEVTISVGKSKIKTKGSGALTLCANPQISEGTEEDMALIFISLLNKLQKGAQETWGSRFGVVLFAPDAKPVKGLLLNENERKISEYSFKGVIERLKPQFKKIFLNDRVQEWLNKRIKEYDELIDQTFKYGKALREIKVFWEANKEAFRHIKGGALRLAIFELIPDIFNNKFESDEWFNKLIETCNENLHVLININIQSLKQMQSSLNEEIIRNWLLKQLTGYKLALAVAVQQFCKSVKEPAKFTPLTMLDSSYIDAINNADERKKLFGLRYEYFGKVREKLNQRKNLDSLNNLFQDYCGFKLQEIEGTIGFIIVDKEKIILNTLIKKGEDGEDGEESSLSSLKSPSFMGVSQNKIETNYIIKAQEGVKSFLRLYKHDEKSRTTKSLIEFFKINFKMDEEESLIVLNKLKNEGLIAEVKANIWMVL